MEQIRMTFEEDFLLSNLIELLYKEPAYLTGGKEEEYHIYRDSRCIQINVYYDKKDVDNKEKIIKKGVYLSKVKDKLYKISSFNNKVIPGLCDYDRGIKYGGGRYGETDATQFLRLFVNQTLIVDNL